MINVCIQCGLYRADKIIEPKGPYAICPECGHKHLFLQIPLFVVSGASGTGKTTILHYLLGKVDEFVLLDSDILWRAEFDHPEDHYREYFETWLRMCKNIGQSGRPVMIFGSGIGVPENIEPCIERRYFSQIHYLALVCNETELEKRLSSRPEWRGCKSKELIQTQKVFNRWFMENGNKGNPKIELLDTTKESIEETASAILAWSKGYKK